MNEETTVITKVEGTATADSSVLGVSVRAWLAVALVITVCLSHLAVSCAVLVDAVIRGDWGKVGTYSTVGEPLYSMSIAALGFYFGQKVSKP